MPLTCAPTLGLGQSSSTRAAPLEILTYERRIAVDGNLARSLSGIERVVGARDA